MTRDTVLAYILVVRSPIVLYKYILLIQSPVTVWPGHESRSGYGQEALPYLETLCG
jgi:hypothetical protein